MFAVPRGTTPGAGRKDTPRSTMVRCRSPLLRARTPARRWLPENPPAFVEEDAFEVHLQGLGVGGLGQRLLLRDLPLLDEFEQRLVEALHAVFGAGLDGGGEFFQPVF